MIDWEVSPSQVNTLDECERKYAFKYVLGIEVPEKPSAALGTATHLQLERYYRGEPLDFTEIVDGRQPAELLATCLHLFPPPAPHIRSEPEWHGVFQGIGFQGRIDVWEQITPTHVRILDLKTTSSIYKWALDEEEIRKDPQSIIYGWHASESADRVDLQWNYTQTRGPKACRSVPDHTDPTDSLIRMQDLILPKANRALTIIQTQPDPNSLPPNLSSCEMYGGCPYKSVCAVNPIERMFGPIKEKDMPDIDDFLKQFDEPTPGKARSQDLLDGIEAAASGGPCPLADLINPPEGKQAPIVSLPKVETAPAVQTKVASDPQGAGVAPTAVEGSKDPGQASAKPKKGAVKKLIGELCLGCAPLGETVTYFSDLMTEVNAKIQADHNLPDWRLIQYTAGAHLALATEQVLRARGHVKILVIDPRSREFPDLAHTLEINADRVFR